MFRPLTAGRELLAHSYNYTVITVELVACYGVPSLVGLPLVVKQMAQQGSVRNQLCRNVTLHTVSDAIGSSVEGLTEALCPNNVLSVNPKWSSSWATLVLCTN